MGVLTAITQKRKAKLDRPQWFFHFVHRERYDQLLALGWIGPYPNEQTKPRPGISLTKLDPRSVPRERTAMANWKSAKALWKTAGFFAIPARKVRRPKRVPRSSEWVTTQGVALGSDCFGGTWDEATSRYQPDLRAPLGPWPT